MALDPVVRTRVQAVRRAVGVASLLALLSLLAGCGSDKPQQPVVTGSTTTCVPMGKTISCSCTPITQPSGS